ncbi:MAG TPA: glycosyltransferase family 4 protein [Planctomycetota bacterium]|nr:glycosyltransferase family 4 protein [Planctomycetota bacterium]
MKVVHLALGKANPARMNGVNVAVHALATHQRRAGIPAEVWGLTRTPEADAGPPREYPLRLFPRPGMPLALPAGLREALDGLGADAVVHFHGGFVPFFYPIARHLAATGRPYLLTPHGAYNRRAMEKGGVWKKLYTALFERPLVRGAASVHCVGRSEAEELPRRFGPVPWFVVPNGHEPGRVFQGSGKAARSGRPLLGYCGRIDMRAKGLDVMAKAFAAYRAGGGTGTLWIIGDGPDLPRLKRALGDGDAAVFWGARFGEEKERLLAELDAFVYPSRHEGFPMGVLEAAALGCCLIVSQETNAGEYVRRHGAGFVLREGSAEELRAAFWELEAAGRRGGWAAFGAAARRMIEEDLNWSRVVRDLVPHYREALERWTAGRGA